MTVQIAALCDSAADYNGKLCLMGTFDTIVARQFPTTHPYCSLALRIVFSTEEEGQHGMKVSLIDEDGKSLLPKIEPTVNIRMPANMFFATVNLVFNLAGLKFEKPGLYRIDVSMDDKIIAGIPLQVLQGATENKPNE
jgi:hypothetical protein